ncbi:hypothetical protein Tco_0640526, partial [Tanacetum coccineum]
TYGIAKVELAVCDLGLRDSDGVLFVRAGVEGYEVVSSADLQQLQVDLDCIYAKDGLHLHGVRAVQDMREADQSW